MYFKNIIDKILKYVNTNINPNIILKYYNMLILISIPGWVIPKTQKMVFGAALLSTQHYKVTIKGKVEQSREWSSALPYTSVW